MGFVSFVHRALTLVKYKLQKTGPAKHTLPISEQDLPNLYLKKPQDLQEIYLQKTRLAAHRLKKHKNTKTRQTLYFQKSNNSCTFDGTRRSNTMLKPVLN